MPAKVFSLVSPKGGSGKTIITATFAAFLAELGKKVLIIDADAATNGLTIFYLKEVLKQEGLAHQQNRIPLGIYEVGFQTDTIPNPEILILPNRVHFIPAIYEFKDTEEAPKQNFYKVLKSFIESQKQNYQYIFIDAQAGTDENAKICMRKNISDEVIIVAEYDPISNNGIERLRGILKDDLNPNRVWILYNKIIPEVAKAYENLFGIQKILPPIPWDSDVVTAYINLDVSLDTKEGNEYTLAIIRIIRTLLKDSISSDLEKWMTSKADKIKQSVEQQYEAIELQIQENDRQQKELVQINIKNAVNRFITILVIFLGLGIVLITFFIIINNFYVWYFILPMIAILVYVSILLTKEITVTQIDPYSQSAMLQVERSYLKRRLDKLEVLKTADLETMMKTKP